MSDSAASCPRSDGSLCGECPDCVADAVNDAQWGDGGIPPFAPSSPAANAHRRGWLDPTFVDGIGPPLEQLEQDYRNVADLENDCMARDVLALIKEVKTLRWELTK